MESQRTGSPKTLAAILAGESLWLLLPGLAILLGSAGRRRGLYRRYRQHGETARRGGSRPWGIGGAGLVLLVRRRTHRAEREVGEEGEEGESRTTGRRPVGDFVWGERRADG